jgi:hypothetical protein
LSTSLVIDASLAFRMVAGPRILQFKADRYLAPSLLWSEMQSARHEALWRREITGEQAYMLRGCLLVTSDLRLRRGADRLGFVVGPTEL